MKMPNRAKRTLTIIRLATAAVVFGFTPTAVLASQIYIKGQAVLESNSWFDLDRGRALGTSGGSAGGDIVFLPASTWLAPGPNVMFSTWNNTPYEEADCERNASISRMGIDLSTMPGGSWLCYRTNEGLFGQMRLSTVPVIGDPVGRLKVEFTTWSR